MTDNSVANGAAPGVLGASMAAETAQQPEVFERILREGSAAIRNVARKIGARRPRFVLLNARGTSDNAAMYGKYLFEVALGLPAGLTSPSTTTVYGARLDLRDVLMITISSSGSSPDLVESTAVARDCGAMTLALTNTPGSPLTEVAALHLDLLAGAEDALPATKTYTAELLTLYLLVDALWGGRGEAAAELPRLARELLARSDEVTAVAERYRFADRLISTGRGYAYPTARQAALLVMETSCMAAHAYSGADLLHGPLTLIRPDFPVLAVVPEGEGARALVPVLDRLLELSADLFVIGEPEAAARGAVSLVLPSGLPEELSPVLEILPLQRLAYEMAVGRGRDPDSPHALRRVTRTR
jgi:glutamine---fructose-6-phosphate transaminase (isomerizing)